MPVRSTVVRDVTAKQQSDTGQSKAIQSSSTSPRLLNYVGFGSFFQEWAFELEKIQNRLSETDFTMIRLSCSPGEVMIVKS